MAGASQSISPAAFAAALKELPLSGLYAKAAEISNSIKHLQRSNEEMREFAAESCESERDRSEMHSYVVENEGVIALMRERIQLLKDEVGSRGQRWIEKEDDDGEGSGRDQTEPVVNGTGSSAEPEPQPESVDGDGQDDGVYL